MQISSCWWVGGWGGGKNGASLLMDMRAFWSDENVLELGSNDDCTISWYVNYLIKKCMFKNYVSCPTPNSLFSLSHCLHSYPSEKLLG